MRRSQQIFTETSKYSSGRNVGSLYQPISFLLKRKAGSLIASCRWNAMQCKDICERTWQCNMWESIMLKHLSSLLPSFGTIKNLDSVDVGAAVGLSHPLTSTVLCLQPNRPWIKKKKWFGWRRKKWLPNQTVVFDQCISCNECQAKWFCSSLRSPTTWRGWGICYQISLY